MLAHSQLVETGEVVFRGVYVRFFFLKEVTS
jgi:hypothetical protein